MQNGQAKFAKLKRKARASVNVDATAFDDHYSMDIVQMSTGNIVRPVLSNCEIRVQVS
jgi:hypothetical protein